MTAKLATDREPRAIITDPVELGLFLESPEPPLGLAQNEVTLIVGRPPADLETGEGQVPGFSGCRSYARHEHVVYRRADGRELTYRYEGDLAYALELDSSGEEGDRG